MPCLGLPAACYVHLLGNIQVDQVYLELTFLTLAMLVVGGVNSLWGAVVGALAISGLDSFLSDAENGQVGFSIPAGSRLVVVGAFMALVLVFLPGGLTGGKEFSLPRQLLRRIGDRARGALSS